MNVTRGAFAVFGFTKQPENLVQSKWSERLDISPRIIDFGNAGRFFFYTSYGDVAESEEMAVLKLGFVRSLTKSPLSAQQLLDQGIVSPRQIDHDVIRGNALLTCFSKQEAKLMVFKDLVSLPQLYYWVSGDELVCSDNLRSLIDLLDHVELNEDTIPFHFIFRHTPGTLTYFENIQRLFPGQLLKWHKGHLVVRCVQDFRFLNEPSVFDSTDPITALYERIKDVVGAYISDVESSGQGFGNLLSGGVDSSLLQLIINEELKSTSRSFSFAPVRTPSFEFEIAYARQASEIFKTEHTFVEFTPEDYPDLITRAVELLGQPVLSDVEPCKLALAEFLAKNVDDLRFFFVAQGADTLFGLGATKNIKGIEALGKIPGARLALASLGWVLQPFFPWKSLTLRKGAEILAHSEDPDFFRAPTNTIAVYSNLEIARRSFGDEAIRRVLAYRRGWEMQYLDTSDYAEKVHVIDLLSDTYEIQVQSGQLFLANNREQIYPFMDEDIVRLSFAIPPEKRYIQGLRVKYLLKDILEQQGLSEIARKPKGGSGFTYDLYAWMHSGPLYERIQAIERPGFLSKADFDKLVEKPDHFLWSLLTFDIFRKKVLGPMHIT